MYDLAIIGAGPAGATLARLVGRNFKTVLFEKRNLEDPAACNEKCCGGLLAPDAQRALATQGLGLPHYVLTGPQLFVVQSIDLATGTKRFYQRHYININRSYFDCWLYRLIPSAVLKLNECLVTAIKKSRRGFIVGYRQAGKNLSLETRLLIGADGARSVVRSGYSSDRQFDQTYFAIQEWHPAPLHPPFYSVLFDPSITDFYAWAIPKNGHLIVGAALDPHNKPLARFALLKQKLIDFGFPVGNAVRRRSDFLLRPRNGNAIITGNADHALVGEAAGFVSPSSGEGLSFALQSSGLLAAALLRDREHFYQLYHKATNSLRRIISLKNLKNPFLFNPSLRSLVMKSGVGSVRIDTETDKTRRGLLRLINNS
jgi:flavin-dependent dehydrogenase